MRHVIDLKHQKRIVVAVAAAVSFFGLEAASQALGVYQVNTFLLIAVYVYVFLVIWQSFIFDLHLKSSYTWSGWEKSLFSALKSRFRYLTERHHFLHFQNYLILPAIIYWSAIGLLFLNPFEQLIKQVVIFVSTAALAVSVWYLKTIFYDHHGAHHTVRQIIFLVKLVASYLSLTAVYGLSLYFGWDILTFSIVVFAVSLLLFHQAFFQHHYNAWRSIEIFSICGLIMAEAAALVFIFWNINYFSGALVIAAVYITSWGIVQHKFIDRNLTREIVYEYLSVLFVIIALVTGMTNFQEKLPPPDENRDQRNYHEAR